MVEWRVSRIEVQLVQGYPPIEVRARVEGYPKINANVPTHMKIKQEVIMRNPRIACNAVLYSQPYHFWADLNWCDGTF
jgi:hypothetical protein